MKQIKVIFILAVFYFVMPAAAQENQQEGADQMKIWMEYMTPGTMHQQMAKMAGEWKTTNKMWMDPEHGTICNRRQSGYRVTSGRKIFEDHPYRYFHGNAFRRIQH